MKLLLCLIILNIFYYSNCFYVQLLNYTNCQNNLPGKLWITFDDTKPQKINVSMDFPFDMDNKLLSKMEYYNILTDNTKVRLASFTDKTGPCDALYLHLGDMWTDMQRRLGVLPPKCPIPKGKRALFNYVPDYGTLRMVNMPRTRMLLTWTWFEKATKDVMVCMKIAFQIS